MPYVLRAREARRCRYCGATLQPGQKFTIQMDSTYHPRPVCLDCAGLISVVCAWCQADMGEKDGKGQTGTTHSICQACLAKDLREPLSGGKKP